MAPTGRNRSEGWRHAKLDGHANEQEFAESIINNQELLSVIETHFLKVSPKDSPIISVDGAKHVESIFGDSTTSKVDVALTWKDGQQVNISLKKSDGGQVWLISVPRFISAIEYYLNQKLDSEVRAGLSLFIGGTNLFNYKSLFDKALANDEMNDPAMAQQENHQSRLVAKSIKSNFPSVWKSTLNFLNSNIGLITKLAFAQGLARFESDTADVLIYNNATDGKSIFPISEIITNAILHTNLKPVTAGPRNGGSTIQLPTGFLQMHHPQGENLLQFHHSYKKISML